MKFFAPGRVNLIGEHLDYNGGLVLPAAITLGITATYTPRHDDKIVLRSATHPLVKELSVKAKIAYDEANGWANYPLGVIAQLRNENHHIPACDIWFETDLPIGSGLSSSAAVEVLTAFTLLSQTESHINRVWLANLCRQVENEFIGIQCGIMDQYAVALGKKDHALLLDCATLKHEYIPFELGSYRLLIMDTQKTRALVHSKYNERRKECEAALRQLRHAKPAIHHLTSADMIWLDVLTDQVLKKRARHVISENLRVKESVKALRYNDLSTFGRLLNASHASLKNNYEVTGNELDTLVDAAQQVKGCLGARMTGAGFGGCAIAIVHESVTEEFEKTVSERYFTATGLSCKIYESKTGDGVHQL